MFDPNVALQVHCKAILNYLSPNRACMPQKNWVIWKKKLNMVYL